MKTVRQPGAARDMTVCLRHDIQAIISRQKSSEIFRQPWHAEGRSFDPAQFFDIRIL